MKKILGLDIGTSSIGWGIINEGESESEPSSIEKLGVRVIPLSSDEKGNFDSGKSFSLTQERTASRGVRRNLQRYKLRREQLKKALYESQIITKETCLTEDGKGTTHELWKLRAQAASEKISLEEFGRVLLAINKKRGYKSNRKAKDDGDGEAIDGMKLAMKLYEEDLTPGQYIFQTLSLENRGIPDFYPSDLQREFDQIWEKQREFYPEQLTPTLKEELYDKNKNATWAILKALFNLVGIDLKSAEGKKLKGFEEKQKQYELRAAALQSKLDPEHLALVLQAINNQKSGTSGYLGEISDRSKSLYFKKQTIGQWGYERLQASVHNRLKKQVFYRQDYMDEFEQIWETQKQFYPSVLTDDLKSQIRDITVFYQRPLKSQKSLIASCELESVIREVFDPKTKQPILSEDGTPKQRLVGPKVISRSNPLFQEFKIWQVLNNLEVRHKTRKEVHKITDLDGDLELRRSLATELNWSAKLTAPQVLKFLTSKPSEWELNYCDGIQGNSTNAAYLTKFQQILESRGYEIKKGKASVVDQVRQCFSDLGFDSEILSFNPDLENQAIEHQVSWTFWHLLYSYQGDNSNSGNEALYRKLYQKYGFDEAAAKVIASIQFIDDYGSLSARAIRKILPYLREGNTYSEAAELAGYRHSNWETAEENAKKTLKDTLEILPKNSLRNPVVEKILNQTFHVVNGVIEKYGKPDEVRIELARALKKSAKERDEATKGIAKATKLYEKYKKEIAMLPQFAGGIRITKNDIIKYKLWLELKENGYKTLYSNTYIAPEEIFSKRFDIEHIIPKALVYDDSFSNKTLELRDVNQQKSNTTAYDFVGSQPMSNLLPLEDYVSQINGLEQAGQISKAKKNKLLKAAKDIGDGFIERDLRNTQYIAKKAQELLREVIRTVTPTTGSITDRLREEWGLTNLMREMNFPHYKALGLTHTETTKDGKKIEVITDWTKRNDQRHHAMDALTVAFTKPAYIQYLNYLNYLHARRDERHKMHPTIFAIQQKYTYINGKQKRLIKPPMLLQELRAAFGNQLEQILVSYKTKNKVTTSNVNRAKTKNGRQRQRTKTPRGQLHKETVYKKVFQQVVSEKKVDSKFDHARIDTVCCPDQREALRARLYENGGDPKLAFTGKNSLSKKPISYLSDGAKNVPEQVKVMELQETFTIRKPISADLKLEKITDQNIKRILTERLAVYGGNAKEAFANLETNPIWQNEEKGIAIKNVTIKGVNEATPIHIQYDHHGKPILSAEGTPIPTAYVQTGNNHHVAIYTDGKGGLQEQVVSHFQVVERVNAGNPTVDTTLNQEIGWEFLFTLKQNEMFVFPDAESGFDPHAIDLLDQKSLSMISKHLYRVQKVAKGDYSFRHHLETVVVRKTKENKDVNEKPLRDIIWKRMGLNGLGSDLPVKVRLNHLGEIVSVGEY